MTFFVILKNATRTNEKHSVQYKFYRFNAGSDQYLVRVWGKNIAMDSKKEAGDMYRKPSKNDPKKDWLPCNLK